MKRNIVEKAKKTFPYIERDVSWMYFNYRILQEANKSEVPLLERLSFLGIYSNNLDEFFRVRVASLNRLLEEPKLDKNTRMNIKRTLKTIGKLNEIYNNEYSHTIDKVMSLLEEYGIRLINETQLTESQQEFLREFYKDRLSGSVIPLWLSQIDNVTSLEDNRIYLLVEKRDNDNKDKAKYAIVRIPDDSHGRWVKLPSDGTTNNIMYLDDVIKYCLPQIFVGMKEGNYRAYSFKFTKDAEMEIDNESDYGIMERIAAGVQSRKHGEAVRLIYDKDMPSELLKKLQGRLNLHHRDTSLASRRYQNHKDLMSFPDCGHDELRYPKWKPLTPQCFLGEESLIDQIRKKDRFLHVPYHSFDGYIRLLCEAAVRPDVKAIKTTLYRLSPKSKVIKALIAAAQNGKKVTVVMELLARFDEESNIMWSKQLQEEGVNVIFGVEGLKVHSKLLFLEMKKGNVACVGTGNFHEGNARVYTDYLMMTARPRIVNDVERVFEFIDRPFSQPRFQDLLVSPNSMKRRIIRYLDNEINNACEGKEAWVKVKINHITDVEIIDKLYEASQNGVKTELAVRGSCSLIPGVEGISDNIRALGLIDRYLEHSRILVFCNGGKPRYYIGSADWMPRNLSRRIEVMTPVYDEDLQKDLLRTIDFLMLDTTNARRIDAKGSNSMQDGETFRSQEELYKQYLNENNKE